MHREATWRALAVTYAIVAGIQLYLALTMHVRWAWEIAVACAAAAGGCTIAAVRHARSAGRLPAPDPAEDRVRAEL
ncbi:hypothetical protein M8542_09390 [Amycolatopsis sp. OK19-0408]|uniref:Uncharacterized protein n=2 Tax=Amycolatopsis iheyensis TaxID=2945988 RepID=A0A9X2N643_9PSEU|nr:hypothetical protein [Amycolatopsis iheyensis]